MLNFYKETMKKIEKPKWYFSITNQERVGRPRGWVAKILDCEFEL